MKHFIFSTIAFLIVGSVWAQKSIINDPNAQVRSVKGFHAIEVSNAIDLYLSQGDNEAVAVSAKDPKYRDHIKTVVEDGVLKISFDSDGWNWSSNDKKLKAYVSFKTLDKLNASGASDVYVDGFINGGNLDISLSGASDFKGAVKLNELKIDQTGASDVSINGTVGNLTIHATGASDVKGYDLVTDNCTAHASGASDIKITVNKALNAHATGASSIYYRGNGVITEVQSSGASSVSKKS